MMGTWGKLLERIFTSRSWSTQGGPFFSFFVCLFVSFCYCCYFQRHFIVSLKSSGWRQRAALQTLWGSKMIPGKKSCPKKVLNKCSSCCTICKQIRKVTFKVFLFLTFHTNYRALIVSWCKWLLVMSSYFFRCHLTRSNPYIAQAQILLRMYKQCCSHKEDIPRTCLGSYIHYVTAWGGSGGLAKWLQHFIREGRSGQMIAVLPRGGPANDYSVPWFWR